MPAEPLEPTLTGIGLTLGAPDIASLPSAGSATRIDVPFKMKDHKGLPKGIQASVRWDPIDVPIVAPDPATEVGGAAPAASAAPSAAACPGRKARAGRKSGGKPGGESGSSGRRGRSERRRERRADDRRH